MGLFFFVWRLAHTMQKEDLAIPDMITQVKREDEETYDGGISARREKGEAEPEDDYEYVYEQPSLFRRIFCCFSAPQAEPVVVKPKDAVIEKGGLLGPQTGDNVGKICLILDLDETLVHSSFQPVEDAHFIIPVEMEDKTHKVYVSKRPFAVEFLNEMGKYFEIVVFTASIPKYADPLLDLLDEQKVISWRLFRDSCTYFKGNYVKDLAKMGRDLKKTMIIDNSSASFMFHPEYAIECITWFDDVKDTELNELAEFLKNMAQVDDVREPIKQWKATH